MGSRAIMYLLTCISKAILLKPMRLNPALYPSGIIIVWSYPVSPGRHLVNQGTRADRRQDDSHAANCIASTYILTAYRFHVRFLERSNPHGVRTTFENFRRSLSSEVSMRITPRVGRYQALPHCACRVAVIVQREHGVFLDACGSSGLSTPRWQLWRGWHVIVRLAKWGKDEGLFREAAMS
jgi:hypothetical protein